MLIDTNIFIEISRAQQHCKECADLIDAINQNLLNQEEIYITRFTLHALEAMISGSDSYFLKKILVMIFREKMRVFDTDTADDLGILSSMEALGFDFDDCLQYMATNKLATYIVTFDKSFQEKGLEVKTPAEVLKKILK